MFSERYYQMHALLRMVPPHIKHPLLVHGWEGQEIIWRKQKLGNLSELLKSQTSREAKTYTYTYTCTCTSTLRKHKLGICRSSNSPKPEPGREACTLGSLHFLPQS